MGLAFLVDLDLFFLEHPQIFWVDPFEMYCERVECRSAKGMGYGPADLIRLEITLLNSSQPFTKALSQGGRSGD